MTGYLMRLRPLLCRGVLVLAPRSWFAGNWVACVQCWCTVLGW